MLYGVDVHTRYQAGISFDKLEDEGYTFAATKASQGTHLTFPDFPRWIERTRNAGLIAGAYHWIDSSAPGAEQCRFFLKALAPVGGPEGLIIQLDCEDNATWLQVKDWAAEWEQQTGGHPWLTYTGSWWWRPRGWDGASLTPLLWDSRYLTADLDTVPDDPAAFAARIPAGWWRLPNKWPQPDAFGYGGWTVATFLQFTSKGDAGGLGNNVDLNATKLTREQLLALTTASRSEVMAALFKVRNKPEVWASDGLRRRHIPSKAALDNFNKAFGSPTVVEVADDQALTDAAGPVDTELGAGGAAVPMTVTLTGSGVVQGLKLEGTATPTAGA